MILPDHEIRQLCQPEPRQSFTGEFEDGDPSRPIFAYTDVPPLIEPFNPGQVEPASYDVRLGRDFRIFQRDATPVINMRSVEDITKPVHVGDGKYFLMHPGEFALGVTLERVNIPNGLVSRIEGKSSVGRLGMFVHVTAGYIDPGFCGNVTLELLCVHPLPVMIWPGELIAQLSFHEMKSPAEQPYQGRYQNAASVESSKYGRHP